MKKDVGKKAKGRQKERQREREREREGKKRVEAGVVFIFVVPRLPRVRAAEQNSEIRRRRGIYCGQPEGAFIFISIMGHRDICARALVKSVPSLFRHY